MNRTKPVKGNLKYDVGYSQYDKSRRFSYCEYCGMVLVSRTTRNRHKRQKHQSELKRY